MPAKTAEFYAYALRTYLDPPDSRRRYWPYALSGDRFIRHRIEMEWPYELPLEQLPELILADGVDYRAEKGVAGKKFFAVHDLHLTSDYVPADRMGRFCDAVDDLLRSLGTTLRRSVVSAPGGDGVNSTASVP